MQVSPYLSHDCFATYNSLKESLAKGQVKRALALYLKEFDWLPCRAYIEWELAWMVSETDEDIEFVSSWPEELLRQNSGSVLAVIVMQKSQQAFTFPSILKDCPPLPKGVRTLLARTLVYHSDVQFLEPFALEPGILFWLAEEAEAIGPCLLLAHRIGLSSFLTQQFPRWVACGLHYPDTPSLLQQLCKSSAFRELILQALRQAFCFFQDQHEQLYRLLEVAYQLESYNTVVAFSESLHLQQLSSTLRSSALAMRIVSLAESGQERVALEEFRQFWVPLSASFPFPEKLLYRMQSRGSWDLERHLLEFYQLNINTPTWVELHVRLFRKLESTASLLLEWESLFQERQRHWTNANTIEPHILYGLTCTYLRGQAQMEREWKESLEGLWKTLYSHESMKWMAGSFLVLIPFFGAEWQDCIPRYEVYLQDAPLSDPFVQQAANAYIQVLLRQKQWAGVLSFFSSQDLGLLKQILSHGDFVYARQMCQILILPETENEVRNWFGRWEILLGCSLGTARIAGMLEFFINIENQLPDEVSQRSDFADISLQILCRAKAEVERLLVEEEESGWNTQEIFERLPKLGHRGTYNLLLERANPSFHGLGFEMG